MQKTKRSYPIDADIESAIGILGVRTGLDGSDLICKILRRDPEMALILEQLHSIPDMPDYAPEKKAKVSA